MVVRSYLTGSTNTSAWQMYDPGERRLYGHDFPDGLKKNQKLPHTIITPTTLQTC
jgi:phosphoribosylaminoimidazole-succinocarboxamide synthase